MNLPKIKVKLLMKLDVLILRIYSYNYPTNKIFWIKISQKINNRISKSYYLLFKDKLWVACLKNKNPRVWYSSRKTTTDYNILTDCKTIN